MNALISQNKAVECKLNKGRYLEADMSGRKVVIYAPGNVGNEQIQDAIDYAYCSLCQTCYMEYVLADNYLIKAKMIFDKKKIFKFALKKHFMECQKSILDTRRLFEEHMDEDYYYEFSNYLWDLVRHKVEKMRKLIENKLRNLKCKYNPYLCSQVIVIQNLVQEVNDTHKNVMKTTERKFGVDITPCFEHYRAKMAFTQADNCLYDIMHDEAEKFRDNIITNKEILAIWSDISRTLYNPTNAKKARFSAYYNMPKETQALYNLREEDGFCELKDGVKRFKKGG